MKRIVSIFLVVIMIWLTVVNSALAHGGNDTESVPFEKLTGSEANKLISEARKSQAYKDAYKMVKSEGFKPTGEAIAVEISGDNSKWAYFYVESKKEHNAKNAPSFIAIDVEGEGSYVKLYRQIDDNLASKSYENGLLVSEIIVNKEGVILDGSYYIADGEKYDLTVINDLGDSGDVRLMFDWGGFWDCLKDNSSESLPLRAELMAACYYACLTGAWGCIVCTVINAGITVGIASYCVYQNW